MVHALERARRRLRPGGMVISIRPHQAWSPSIAVIAKGRRVPIAQLRLGSFASNLEASDAALRRVIADGSYERVGAAWPARWRTELDRPGQMRTYLEMITPPRPRFPRGARARLSQVWASMEPGARIEIIEPLIMDALRRR